MKRSIGRMVLGVGLGGLVALGVGCSGPKTYTANITNTAGQPLQAKLFEDREGGKSVESRIGPGDNGALSLVSSRGSLVVEVDVAGNRGVPKRVQVGPGDSDVKVWDEDRSSNTKLEITVTENY